MCAISILNTGIVITERCKFTMRETTRLLCEHVHIQLAELIESYIMPGKNKGGLDYVHKMFIAGHWELCSSYFSEYWSSHCGLIGAIRGNSIHLVRVMLDLSAVNLYDYDQIAIANKCDPEIVELLQSRIRKNKKMRLG